jgi:PAS domain S-box-containing protein
VLALMPVVAIVLALALGAALALGVRARRRYCISERRFRSLLEQSEASSRSLFENLAIGIYRTTPEGGILLANTALLRMLGYGTFRELCARNLEAGDFEPAHDRRSFNAELKRVGEILGREALWKTSDGRTITVRENARVVRDERGAILYYEGTLEDVTARKRAEQGLAEANSKLEAVIRQSPLAIGTLDLEGRVTSWNPTAEQTFGWTQKELLGEKIPVFKYSDQELQLRLEACRNGEFLRAGERLTLRKDGSEIETLLWTTTLSDVSGSAAGFLVTFADDTERKQREAQLFDTEQRYRELFENAHDIVYSIDLEGNYTSINAAGERVSGYERAELLRMNIADLVEPARLEYARQRIQASLAGAPPEPFELTCRKKDGSPMQLEISGRLRFKDGVPVGIQGIIRDITERKRWERQLEQSALELKQKNAELSQALEAAREASKAKSSFLANMSHELRTPVHGVVGMTDLLFATPLNSEQREYSEAIRHSAEALLATISDILDLTQIEAGKLALETAPFDLRSMVNDVVGCLSPKARRKGIGLNRSIGERVPGMVRGDSKRMQQILTNLVVNALKFTEQGEVEVLVAVDQELEHRATVLFTVLDTGIGVAPERAPTIFGAFAQADDSNTRRYDGAGLGLAISKYLVENMGGSIGFESRPAGGSKFWFRLPLENERTAPHAEARGSENMPPEPRGVARVLLADDNEVNRRIGLRVLERAGYEAAAVSDGKRAVAEVLTGRYDLVLMDVQMPEMDGFEATAQIRREEGDSRHTPVIAMTARASRGDREKCIEAGMDDYISKPVHRQELTRTVEHWLRRSSD